MKSPINHILKKSQIYVFLDSDKHWRENLKLRKDMGMCVCVCSICMCMWETGEIWINTMWQTCLQSILHLLINVIIIAVLCSRYHCVHFSDEKIKLEIVSIPHPITFWQDLCHYHLNSYSLSPESNSLQFLQGMTSGTYRERTFRILFIPSKPPSHYLSLKPPKPSLVSVVFATGETGWIGIQENESKRTYSNVFR